MGLVVLHDGTFDRHHPGRAAAQRQPLRCRCTLHPKMTPSSLPFERTRHQAAQEVFSEKHIDQ